MNGLVVNGSVMVVVTVNGGSIANIFRFSVCKVVGSRGGKVIGRWMVRDCLVLVGFERGKKR